MSLSEAGMYRSPCRSCHRVHAADGRQHRARYAPRSAGPISAVTEWLIRGVAVIGFGRRRRQGKDDRAAQEAGKHSAGETRPTLRSTMTEAEVELQSTEGYGRGRHSRASRTSCFCRKGDEGGRR